MFYIKKKNKNQYNEYDVITKLNLIEKKKTLWHTSKKPQKLHSLMRVLSKAKG